MSNTNDIFQVDYQPEKKEIRINPEVQRLRAALDKITKIFDDPNLHELTACQEMNKVAREALSTTTEPTDAAKVEQVREGAGNDA